MFFVVFFGRRSLATLFAAFSKFIVSAAFFAHSKIAFQTPQMVTRLMKCEKNVEKSAILLPYTTSDDSLHKIHLLSILFPYTYSERCFFVVIRGTANFSHSMKQCSSKLLWFCTVKTPSSWAKFIFEMVLLKFILPLFLMLIGSTCLRFFLLWIMSVRWSSSMIYIIDRCIIILVKVNIFSQMFDWTLNSIGF